jgi:cytoskeletal protein CcmA (bactofilin family)
MSLTSTRRFAHTMAAATGLALALAGLTGGAALATDSRQAGPMVSVTGDGGNIEAAGASVNVTGTASRLRAAGALVTVNAASTGDTEVAGAQVAVSGSTGGNLRTGGAVVDVSGTVTGNADVGGAVVKVSLSTAGNLRVGGASVVIAPANDVRGSLQAFGAVVTIGGHIGGPVQAGGAVVTFDGQADGAVEIAGSRVVIGPNARIAGDLTVRSLNAPEIQAGSVISGTVSQEQPQTWWSVAPWQVAAVVAAAIAAGTILAGIVLLLFGGHVFTTATEHVRHRPLSSFLFGILALVLIPFVAIVLMVTVIGLSIGFAILFILPLLLTFGHAVAAAGIASGLLVRRRGDIGVPMAILMLIIGAIVLVLLGLIPWVGPILVLIALVLGVGAFTRTIGGRIRRAGPSPMV